MKIRNRQRNGAATVEFALTAPLLFLLLFGSYELNRANMIMHTCESAAYEGARVGMVPGATAAEVREAAEGILGTVGVRNATVTITPANLSTQSDAVAVTINVGFDDNSLLAPLFVGGQRLERTCELLREIP